MFSSIRLKSCAGGNWLELDGNEMMIINIALRNAGSVSNDGKYDDYDA